MSCKRVCLVLLLLALGCSAPIEHGLDEAAANEVVTNLERAGMPASKQREDDGGFTVSVARGEVLGALELLRSLGLPRGRRSGFGEVYKQGSLLPTPTEERARYVEALAGEIARTLELFDGVIQARVHLVLPEPEPLAADGKPRLPAQAAVLVKQAPGRPAGVSEGEVQKLVAGSVAGLVPAQVSVVFTMASAPAAKPAGVVTLGPLQVAAGSRGRLIALGVSACAAIAFLAALALVLARRLAAAERRS
jgi:type III secretion protein J